MKFKFANAPVVCSLMLDEMALKQHIKFDGQKYYGGIDLGTGIESNNLEKAKKCLVLIVVSINENWKAYWIFSY